MTAYTITTDEDGFFVARGPSHPGGRYVVAVASHPNARGTVVAGPTSMEECKRIIARRSLRDHARVVRILRVISNERTDR